tara:strand:- start:1619 stop:2476 length:858 start_codon:yes stop_codon:yes gene_type:complete
VSDTEIRAQVTRVNYHKESRSGFWCIIKTDAGTAKGEIRWVPQNGERIKFRGSWSTYQGERQFKFTFAMPDIPDNPRAQLHYVCHMAKGIGDSIEEKIWQTYNEEWKHIEPDVISGMSTTKFKSFMEAMSMLDKSQDYVEALTWLLSIGATHNLADVAFEKWGEETIGVVNQDPYQLASLPNYGFKDADKLREKFGIGDDDDRRIAAVIRYLIGQAMSNGDTATHWKDIQDGFVELLGRDKVALLVKTIGKMMYETKELHGWSDTKMISLMDAYDNERMVWEWTQ